MHSTDDAEWYIKQALTAADSVTLAITNEEGEVVGAAAFKEHKNNVRIHYLGSVQRGAGTRLVKMVEALGKPIKLLSERSAVGFYKKLGFRIVRKGALACEMQKTALR